MATGMDAGRGIHDPSITTLREAALVTAGVVAVISAGLSLSGLAPGASFVFGGSTAMAVLAIAPLLQLLTRRMDPVAVLVIGVLLYASVSALALLSYSLINDMPWIKVTPVVMGGLIAIAAWVAGHLWSVQRMRQRQASGPERHG